MLHGDSTIFFYYELVLRRFNCYLKFTLHFCQAGKSLVGKIPRSVAVAIEDDLTDMCKAGDDVTVIGDVTRRWSRLGGFVHGAF